MAKTTRVVNQAKRILAIGGLIVGGGCISQPPASLAPVPKPIFTLTRNVEVLNARIVSSPCTSIDTPPVKGTCHEVLVKWRNNGPSPVGNVRAKIQTWDATGNELPYSLDKISIFVARDPKDRIPAGHVYDEPVGSGYTLLMGENTPVRVKVTVVYADNSTPAFPDNSSAYEPGHYEGAGATP